jgi:hypothetical protein
MLHAITKNTALDDSQRADQIFSVLERMKTRKIKPDSHTVHSTIGALSRVSTSKHLEMTWTIILALMRKDAKEIAHELLYLKKIVKKMDVADMGDEGCLTIAIAIDTCKFGYHVTGDKVWMRRVRQVWEFAHSDRGPRVLNVNCLTSFCEFLIPCGEAGAREAVGMVKDAFNGEKRGERKFIGADQKLLRHVLGLLRTEGEEGMVEEVVGFLRSSGFSRWERWSEGKKI